MESLSSRFHANNAERTGILASPLSYKYHFGYFAAMKTQMEQQPAPVPVAPKAALRAEDVLTLEWRDGKLELRPLFSLSARQRQQILASMLEPGGLQGACDRAGVTLGMVLGERLRNPAFRRQWEKAQNERRAILGTLMTDMVVRGFLPEPGQQLAESREKFLAGIAQALAGEAAPGRGRKPAAAKPPATKQPADKAAPMATLPADELENLIADVERKIASAETEFGIGGLPAPERPR